MPFIVIHPLLLTDQRTKLQISVSRWFIKKKERRQKLHKVV